MDTILYFFSLCSVRTRPGNYLWKLKFVQWQARSIWEGSGTRSILEAPYLILSLGGAKPIWAKQRRIKNAPYKNNSGQKMGTKQLKTKIGTLQKCLCPKKSETNSVRSKNAAYKNDRGQKIGAKQLKIKNGTL